MWYLNCSDDQQSYESAENGIREAKNGYWKPVDSSRIPTSTGILGMKIILEFYEGQASCGKRTGWMMHEYQVEQNDEANLPQVSNGFSNDQLFSNDDDWQWYILHFWQEYKSLCKVFFQGDNWDGAESQPNSLNVDAPKDNLESYLQYLAKLEEPKVIYIFICSLLSSHVSVYCCEILAPVWSIILN